MILPFIKVLSLSGERKYFLRNNFQQIFLQNKAIRAFIRDGIKSIIKSILMKKYACVAIEM